MGIFSKKEWKRRETEFPTRRRLTPTGQENVVDVAREEGLVMEDGDAFSPSTMNDLEERIEAALDAIQATASAAQTTANAAMPKAGGKFTGAVTASAGAANKTVRNVYTNTAASWPAGYGVGDILLVTV